MDTMYETAATNYTHIILQLWKEVLYAPDFAFVAPELKTYYNNCVHADASGRLNTREFFLLLWDFVYARPSRSTQVRDIIGAIEAH